MLSVVLLVLLVLFISEGLTEEGKSSWIMVLPRPPKDYSAEGWTV